MNTTMRAILGAMADSLFPRRCGGCDSPMHEVPGAMCWACRSSFRVIGEPMCAKCGNPIQGRADHEFICAHCDVMRPQFDRARSAVRFEGAAAEAIHRFKYNGAIWLCEELANWLETCVRVWYADLRPDFVCPVPLYPARRRQRGYNQAELLSALLARRMNWRHEPAALRRTRPTETQTHLTAAQRLSNVHQAFAVRSADCVKGRTALLVDDVMTTGATVSACARALKAAGASCVVVATLARGQ